MPEYKYSRPGGGSQTYQTTPPQRVTPVGASSFSGPSGGGGLFPFLPFNIPSSDTAPDPSASENSSVQEYARDLGINVDSEGSTARRNQESKSWQFEQETPKRKSESSQSWQFQGQKPEASYHFSKEGMNEGNETKQTEQSSETKQTDERFISERMNSLNRLNSLNSSSFTFSSKELDTPSFRFSSSVVDRPSFQASGKFVTEPGFKASGKVTPVNQFRQVSESDLWHRVDESQLPDKVDSFKVAKADPVNIPEPVQTMKPLRQTGSMSFGNVQNLPIPEAPARVQQTEPSFWDNVKSGFNDFVNFAYEYHHDKMEHPIREIATQTGAALLAGPLIAAGSALAPVASAAVPLAQAASSNIVPISQAAQRVAPVVQKVAQNSGNIVNFSDFARKAAPIAAGVAGAVALPAAAQTAWNGQTQKYSAQNVKGRL